jgi:CRP-like cAMP-binding protein
VIRKLESTFSLSDEEREAVLRLPLQVAEIRADQDVVREGDRPSRCFAILEGFTCTYKFTGTGKRQIMAFHIAGDIPDLQSLHLKLMDNSISTVARCKVGFIQHHAMHDLCLRHPRITSAFWRDTLIEAANFREWIANIGRRDGVSRMAHIFCEILVRMRAVGLTDDHSCDLPITQAELGDALGLSTVHVNRTLQELRGAGLLQLERGRLTVLNWDELKDVGDFDPAYLHLQKAQAVA